MAYLGRKGQTAALNSADLPTNSISTDHLIANSVTSAKIGVDVIVAEDIANNAITVAEIADDAVTGAKLANDIAITTTGALTGTTGDFNWDSNTLVVDSSESRVGIGTDAPGSQVDIQGPAGTGTATAGVLRLSTAETSIVEHDQFGRIDFIAPLEGSGTDAILVGASIWGVATDTFTTTANKSALVFATGTSETATEKMRITDTGNVGIGTDSPLYFVDLANEADTQSYDQYIRFGCQNTSGESGGLIWRSAHSEPYSKFSAKIAGVAQGNYFRLGLGFYTGNDSDSSTNAVERMRIDSTGKVRVLCANMGSDPSSSNKGVMLGDTNSGSSFFGSGSGTETHLVFGNTTGVCGTIQTSSSATSFNTSSDYRLKGNVVPMSGSIDRLKALKPSRFNFIVEADRTLDGFLAHEAQEVVPEAVTGAKDAMKTEEYEVTPAVEEVRDDEGNVTTEAVPAVMGEREVPDMQGIDQSKLVPLLVGALQEAIARIETLENA